MLRSDPLRVRLRALHPNWLTVQPLPVSQSGGSQAPHCRFKTCFTAGQGFREVQVEGRAGDVMASGGRKGGGTGRPTPAAR